MVLNLNMSHWYNYLLCVAMIAGGVLLLVKSSDLFVDSASFFAKKLKIPLYKQTLNCFGNEFRYEEVKY